MSTNNKYNRIKSKISEDKVLKEYKETKSKLINEGYKPTEDKVLQKYNETRMKLLSEGYRSTNQTVKTSPTMHYNQHRSKVIGRLNKEDSESLKLATYTWVGFLFSAFFVLFLIASAT